MFKLKRMFSLAVFLFLPLLFAQRAASQSERILDATQTSGGAYQVSQSLLQDSYGKLPFSFEVNQGQFSRTVGFVSRGRGYTLFLAPTEAVMAFSKRSPEHAAVGQANLRVPARKHKTQLEPQEAVLRLGLLGVNATTRAEGLDELPGKVNYFIGNDPKKWRTNVPTYQRVRYHDVYRGVDLVYYANQDRLEYDFIVAPYADPKAIDFIVEGADTLRTDAQGNLTLQISGEEVLLEKPQIYQETAGVRRRVAGGYKLSSRNRVCFRLGAYDRREPLIIDPRVLYSTYLGGNNNSNFSFAIAVDGAGSAYVTGSTASTDFPTTSGAFQTSNGAGFRAFVSKLNPEGTGLIYSTYLGGSGPDDGAASIAIDASGNAYVTGATSSSDFPTTPGAFRPWPALETIHSSRS